MDSTVQNNAEDLKNLLENLGAAPAHLVGHSYGGFVAVYLAAQSPQLIRSLVLVEPAVSTMLVEDPDSNAQMLGLLLRSPSIALAARRFQSSSLRPSLKALDAGDMQAVARLNVDGVMGRDGAFDTLPDWAKSMAVDNARTVGELRTRFPPFKDRARKVTCDTLVINGELSPPWSRRIGRLLVRALPRAEGATIMGSSHFPHIEKPDQFNKIVLDFLERHKAAAVGPAIPEQVQRPIGVP